MRGVNIIGIGSYVPTHVVTNSDLAAIVDTSDEWIQSRTGIKERHIAQEKETVGRMAVKAAFDAISFAGADPKSIDLIIVATTTPDRFVSAVACEVQAAIGAEHAGAFDVRAACSGFVYALAIGTQFIRTGNCKRVLIISSEILSHFVDWTDRNTCVLFGDGAGAMLLEASEGSDDVLSLVLGSDGNHGKLIQLENRGDTLPLPDMNEKTAGCEHLYKSPSVATICMDGKATYEFAVKIMPEAVLSACRLAKVPLSDIDLLIPHQANQRIISAAARRLKIDSDKVVSCVDHFGNTSSASIPLALSDLLRQQEMSNPSLVALVGFGAGLTWGAAVISFSAQDKRRVVA
jgi:3-oxoacyl-[acyl-carrier-protein] synthase-3